MIFTKYVYIALALLACLLAVHGQDEHYTYRLEGNGLPPPN
jgi:hypothetical protein